MAAGLSTSLMNFKSSLVIKLGAGRIFIVGKELGATGYQGFPG